VAVTDADLKIFVDATRPASLNDGVGSQTDFATLEAAVVAWRSLPSAKKIRATVTVFGGPVYRAQTLMNGVDTANIYAICDSYGGAIANTAPDATAFAHRKGTLYCLQYGTDHFSAAETAQRLGAMRSFYAAMRPYVSGAAYVNYCDLDLADYATAYWGQNLPRLKQIKSAFDPGNVFKHAQSIPLV
jgi:hypothetical protein